jgi:hypothetical protein
MTISAGILGTLNINICRATQMQRDSIVWTSLTLSILALGLFLFGSHVGAQPATSQETWQLHIDQAGIIAWKLNSATGDLFLCIPQRSAPAANCERMTSSPN